MKTEHYLIDHDITTFYVAADSFPSGVAKAHKQLRALLPSTENRNFFGISRPDRNGIITYMIAVEETFKEEGKKYGCKTLTLKKGNYISVVIKDYEKVIENLGSVFMSLLKDPSIDKEGYCVEMYIGEEDVRCMVRLSK